MTTIPTKEINDRLGIDFGPARPRDLTGDDYRRMFGLQQTVRMNFVPRMLSAIVMDLTTQLVNLCVRTRQKRFKKITRILRLCVEEYAKALAERYGPEKTAAYAEYVRMVKAETATELEKMRLFYDTKAKNQWRDRQSVSVPVIVVMIAIIIAYIETFNAAIDKDLERRLGAPVTRRGDTYLEIIHAMCVEIAETYDCRVEIDQQGALWAKVIANKIIFLSDRLLKEQEGGNID
ncbi:MAG: hypothetical protein LIO91_10400 [Bacteroidales bacterium]|nr:hypothetical protein [Bacteroidales bacterium]